MPVLKQLVLSKNNCWVHLTLFLYSFVIWNKNTNLAWKSNALDTDIILSVHLTKHSFINTHSKVNQVTLHLGGLLYILLPFSISLYRQLKIFYKCTLKASVVINILNSTNMITSAPTITVIWGSHCSEDIKPASKVDQRNFYHSEILTSTI
jgi:hypothetical protein